MTTAVSPCVHVWDIEPAKGPTSQGACTRCGETREFRNRPSYEEVDALVVLEGVHRLHPEKHNVVLQLVKKPKKEEENEVTKHDPANIRERAKELAPLREKFNEMFNAGKKMAEILEAPDFKDVPLSTIKTWKHRVKPTSHIVEVEVPVGARAVSEAIARDISEKIKGHVPYPGTTVPMPEAVPDHSHTQATPGQPQGGVIGPLKILKAETPDVLWEDIMKLRPAFSDKPRLGRWMDMVDAAYAFLVECDHE